jgi:hypothetical protein
MARPHSSVDSSIVKFSIVDEGSVIPVPAEVAGGRVRINPEALQEGLGWKLETEGLCRGEVCVPVRDRDALYDGNSIDLAAFATALGRPLALDVEERTAAIGTAPADRATLMANLEAPDFTLPDLEGKLHSLSEHRGKKVLLVAYASW